MVFLEFEITAVASKLSSVGVISDTNGCIGFNFKLETLKFSNLLLSSFSLWAFIDFGVVSAILEFADSASNLAITSSL